MTDFRRSFVQDSVAFFQNYWTEPPARPPAQNRRIQFESFAFATCRTAAA